MARTNPLEGSSCHALRCASLCPCIRLCICSCICSCIHSCIHSCMAGGRSSERSLKNPATSMERTAGLPRGSSAGAGPDVASVTTHRRSSTSVEVLKRRSRKGAPSDPTRPKPVVMSVVSGMSCKSFMSFMSCMSNARCRDRGGAETRKSRRTGVASACGVTCLSVSGMISRLPPVLPWDRCHRGCRGGLRGGPRCHPRCLHCVRSPS